MLLFFKKALAYLKSINFHSVVYKITAILLFMSFMTAMISYIGITKIHDINQVANDIFLSNSTVLYPLADAMELILSVEHIAASAVDGNSSAISQISSQISNVPGQLANFQPFLANVDAKKIESQMNEYRISLQDLYNELRQNGSSIGQFYYNFREKSANLNKSLYELSKKSRIKGLETYNRGKKIYGSVILLQTCITVFVMLIAIFIGAIVSISIIRPLQKLRKTTEILAHGNLRVNVDIKSKDEVGAVAAAFNKAIEELRSMVNEATVDAENITAASNELFKVTDETTRSVNELHLLVDDLANGANIQSKTVNSAITSIKKAIEGANSVIISTYQMKTTCNEASVAAERGKDAANEMIEAINVLVETVTEINHLVQNLVKDSSAIQNMLDVIRDIAEKTNLLSLNASIEAARAGEHGRGFEVVATSIRQLSIQSQESVKNIDEVIESIRKNTNHAVLAVEHGNEQVHMSRTTLIETANLFQELIKQVDQIISSISIITNTTAQMNEYDQVVIADITKVYQISEANLTAVEEVSATFEEQLASTTIINDAARKLKTMAVQLSEVANRFSV